LESAWHVGQLIAGRYRLTSRLGHAGSRDIWLVHGRWLGRTVMLRRFKNVPLTGAERYGRIASLARLDHPALIAIRDFSYVSDGAGWVVMGWPGGTTLRERLDGVGTLSRADDRSGRGPAGGPRISSRRRDHSREHPA
jgi:hypothetical protein